jgi:hypothetical protein
MVFPITRCGSGSNRDTALALLFHPIHVGGAFINFAEFVLLASVK